MMMRAGEGLCRQGLVHRTQQQRATGYNQRGPVSAKVPRASSPGGERPPLRRTVVAATLCRRRRVRVPSTAPRPRAPKVSSGRGWRRGGTHDTGAPARETPIHCCKCREGVFNGFVGRMQFGVNRNRRRPLLAWEPRTTPARPGACATAQATRPTRSATAVLSSATRAGAAAPKDAQKGCGRAHAQESRMGRRWRETLWSSLEEHHGMARQHARSKARRSRSLGRLRTAADSAPAACATQREACCGAALLRLPADSGCAEVPTDTPASAPWAPPVDTAALLGSSMAHMPVVTSAR